MLANFQTRSKHMRVLWCYYINLNFKINYHQRI